ncbi:MAG: hypothetical protein CMB62_00620 [Euryarchaeota archaeon]|nr:hypothetical protein [Euryarchaeota archaeon]|tara:strand:+ start:126 stop:653 length:528 start_codon:yes stop_codon:yes gene_type:complete
MKTLKISNMKGVSNMNKITILFFAMLIPSACAEMAHTPKEVSEGTTFTAWIDADDDVESVTFYVCTLEEPHTCYKPQKMAKNESQNNRFQFDYQVKTNDFPGYKYELEKQDNSTEKIPASEYSYYDGMEVEKMGDSYYFKVNVKVTESSEDSGLPNLSFISTITIISIIVIAGRK